MQSDDCSAGTEAESWMYLTNLCLPGISEESGALGNWDYHIHPTIDEIAEILGRVRFGGGRNHSPPCVALHKTSSAPDSDSSVLFVFTLHQTQELMFAHDLEQLNLR